VSAVCVGVDGENNEGLLVWLLVSLLNRLRTQGFCVDVVRVESDVEAMVDGVADEMGAVVDVGDCVVATVMGVVCLL